MGGKQAFKPEQYILYKTSRKRLLRRSFHIKKPNEYCVHTSKKVPIKKIKNKKGKGLQKRTFRNFLWKFGRSARIPSNMLKFCNSLIWIISCSNAPKTDDTWAQKKIIY